PGAASRPHSPVNTTSRITRGLVSAKKSRQSAGRAWVWAAVAVIATRAPPARRQARTGGKGLVRRAGLRPDRVVVRVVILDHRQCSELVVRRRARQRPFERGRAFAPVVAGRLLARGVG